MGEASLQTIAQYCDRILDTRSFTDWPGAVNGLQVENRGRVTRIAAAVDGTLATVRLAAAAGANLLVVHHGLFWSPSYPWTGRRYVLLRLLLENDMAVYSSHLPLDAHPKLGNNVLLARALRLKHLKPFFLEKERLIGWRGERRLSVAEVEQRLESSLGAKPKLLPGGPQLCHKIGIVTGGAGDQLARAAKEGIDTFITGEGPHWTYAMAEEAGINVFYGGHYATETFGVKALAADLARRFKIPWIFIDHPTGL